MITTLLQKKCVPCEGGMPPLTEEQATKLLQETPGWELYENAIQRSFTFKTFKDAIGFVNAIAEVADAEGHHPDIYIYFRKVKLKLTTHAIKGLSENDFILAAKINQILEERK